MKFSEPIIIKAEVVTPIHIGSGEEVKPLSYVADKEFVYVINDDEFFKSLTEREQELYLKWLEPIINKVGDIAEKISQAKRERNKVLLGNLNRERKKVESFMTLETFLRGELKVEPLRFLSDRKCIAYSVRYTLNPETEVFKPFIKDTSFKPYIPATELKGAIRNAFVFSAMVGKWQKYSNLLSDSELKTKIRDALNLQAIREGRERSKREGKLRKEINKKYQSIVKEIDQDFLRGKANDPKFDLFKLFHLEDPPVLSIENLAIQPIKVLNSRRNIRFFLETLMPKTSFNFTLRIPDLSHPSVEKGLKELDLWQLREKLSINKILSFSYTRSAKILEEEAKYFANLPEIMRVIDSLIKMNKQNAPLLRLGAGQGFFGVTANLQIKNKDPNLYDESIRKGISFLRRWRTQPFNFPKTRRVVVNKTGTPINILGWLKITPITGE